MTNQRLPVIGGDSKSGSQGSGLARRDFALLLLGWLATLGSLGAAAAAALRGLVPNLLFEPNLRYRVGRPEDYAVESVFFLEEIRAFVIRRGHSFRSMSAVCTHLGCTVNREAGTEGRFRCPCHGSVFDLDGRVLAGPAPAPLPSYSVSLARDGRLVVDRDRIVSADRYLVLAEPVENTEDERV